MWSVNPVVVSILTPSLNQGRWLEDNLRSVAAQTFPEVEHVVVDGGSSDGSLDILRRSDRSVSWWSEPDEGQSHAINKAFGRSRGEIIGWLNSDDAYFDSRAVAAVVRLFQARPDVGVVYGHAALTNADGVLLHAIWVPPFSLAVLRRYNFIIQPAAFIRRSVLEGTLVRQAYDYAMDRELWLRLARRTRIQRIHRILAIDRHHMARKSYTRLDLLQKDSQRLAEEYGTPDRGRSGTVLRPLSFAFRVAGLSLLPAMLRTSPPFRSPQICAHELVIRQLLQRRTQMPSEQR